MSLKHEPVLNYDFTLEEAGARGEWQQANRYSLWVGREDSADLKYAVIERHDQGFVRLPPKPRVMRLIPAGTPFRIAHLFAPFRISDADMVYIRAAIDDAVYHTLLSATSRAVKEDWVAWFCRKCAAEMERARFDTGRNGLIAFWPFMLDQVRAWNAAPGRHRCKECGAEHGACYGFDAERDRPEEAAARAAG
jgi:hypothetical protein